jgi:hypothetical protein
MGPGRNDFHYLQQTLQRQKKGANRPIVNPQTSKQKYLWILRMGWQPWNLLRRWLFLCLPNALPSFGSDAKNA